MSDLEFDLLDELYFIQSYHQIKDTLGWDDDMLRATLDQLQKKGWIKCYASPNEELFGKEIDLQTQYRNYYYLASKEGLFAHNSSKHYD